MPLGAFPAGERSTALPPPLAAATVCGMSLRDQFKKAKLLSDKEARRLEHEARIERKEKGREQLEQEQKEREQQVRELQTKEREASNCRRAKHRSCGPGNCASCAGGRRARTSTGCCRPSWRAGSHASNRRRWCSRRVAS